MNYNLSGTAGNCNSSQNEKFETGFFVCYKRRNTAFLLCILTSITKKVNLTQNALRALSCLFLTNKNILISMTKKVNLVLCLVESSLTRIFDLKTRL